MDSIRNALGEAFVRVIHGPDANIPKSIARRRKENAPKPLPNRRPRALSIDDASITEVPYVQIQHESEKISKKLQYFSPQTKSRLLSCPPEIRALIWSYVIASWDLHMVRASKKLWAIHCAAEINYHRPLCAHNCWGISDKPFYGYHGTTPGYCYSTRGYPRFRDGVPLLQTCRLVYSETVGMLYEENTFIFNHVDTILSFSQATIASRFRSIRKIKLAYSFPFFMYRESKDVVPPYDSGTWDETCRLLASITSLKELYIHLGGWGLGCEIESILKPLHQIRQPDVFAISVGVIGDPEQLYSVGDKPFRFVTKRYPICEDGICC